MKSLSWIIGASMVAGAVALGACEQQASAPAMDGNTATASEVAGADQAAPSQAPLAKSASDGGLQWGPCPEGMPEGCGIAVLQGDPAKPNSDIFLRVPGRASIPPHAHTSAERMILVSGELDVKYQGAPSAKLRAGHYAYGPAKLPHQATCRSSEQCILFIAFEGPVDVLPFEGTLQ